MPGVAIVADTTWAAFEARKQAARGLGRIHRLEGQLDARLVERAAGARQAAGGRQGRCGSTGDIDEALAGAAKTVEAFYTYPFVSHAPLEPQNCTAWSHDGIVEFWSPTQTADRALETGGRRARRARRKGQDQPDARGRRLRPTTHERLHVRSRRDRAALRRRPVKLVWTREQDMAHDFFRAGGFHSLAGGVDAPANSSPGAITSSPSRTTARRRPAAPTGRRSSFPAQNLPNFQLSHTLLPLKTPTGPWRAPRSCAVAWVIQSFLHELRSPPGAIIANSCSRSWVSRACSRAASTPAARPT